MIHVGGEGKAARISLPGEMDSSSLEDGESLITSAVEKDHSDCEKNGLGEGLEGEKQSWLNLKPGDF